VRLLIFIVRRVAYLVFQLLGVVTITFFLVHLLPGNPAIALAGPGARPETILLIERELGTDKPLPIQYFIYLNDVIHGRLGQSIFTGQPVLVDLKQRLPATLELVTISMLLSILIGIPLGIYVAAHRESILSRVAFAYGMLTGSLPDFWLGLILIFVFFFSLHWAPAPLGRFPVDAQPPTHITGLYTIDSLVTGNLGALATALGQLALPVVTLVLVYMGNITKMTISSMQEVAGSDFIEYARASGLPPRVILRYSLRNALAPVVTVVAFNYSFLIGGAVLVETVFSWGGLGQYAVQSITSGDYAPITGFVLIVALFMAANYLMLDLVYAALDPRIEY
jgi:ABC-type dipeptide/oligopeptide/nickel transport system permease component